MQDPTTDPSVYKTQELINQAFLKANAVVSNITLIIECGTFLHSTAPHPAYSEGKPPF